MKVDWDNVAMWSFMGGLYAFACGLLIAISVFAVSTPWPAKWILIPLWMSIAGLWGFLTIMLGRRAFKS